MEKVAHPHLLSHLYCSVSTPVHLNSRHPWHHNPPSTDPPRSLGTSQGWHQQRHPHPPKAFTLIQTHVQQLSLRVSQTWSSCGRCTVPHSRPS
jgi:hypothetical protein